MDSEWIVAKASEVCGNQKNAMSTGPFGSAISSKYFTDIGVPVIRGSNLSQDVGVRLDHENLVFVTEEKAEEFARSTVGRGDLIFTCWGTIDQVGLIDEKCKFEKYVISNKQMKMTPDPSIADSRFLYYQFASPKMRSWIIDNGIGSSVPGFNLGMLKNIDLNIPPVPTQKAIAHILGTLEDKIELNRQMNKTLEAMAQALFKSWFVDFDPVIDNALAAGNNIPDELKARAAARQALGDQRKPLPAEIQRQFPDKFVLSDEMGWIPEGWNSSKLSDIARLMTTSVLPNKEPETVWTHFSIPAFDDGQHPTLDLGETIKSGKYRVPSHAVLASKLNPQFPRVWMPDVQDERYAICSTEFMPFEPNEPAERPFLYSLFCSKTIQTEIENRVTGSTGSRQRVKPKEIAELPLLGVPAPLRQVFSKMARAWFERQSTNQQQQKTLTELRDTLLPKLMSGELHVPEAEKLVGEAV